MQALLRHLCLALFLPLLLSASSPSVDRKLSPFDGMRWEGDQPEVLIEATWYRPVSIHGTEVSEILEFCEKRWPDKREKRFAEDLVEAMEEMGVSPPDAVDLVLVRLEDDKEVALRGVEMTKRKRDALRDATRSKRPAPPAVLKRAQAVQDLLEFQARLEDQFAYLHLKGIDLKAEIARLTESLKDEVTSEELADQLNQLLLRFGDGHAGVLSPYTKNAEHYPPVLLAEADGGVVAFKSDRSELLDANRPFVISIDGRKIDEWIDGLRPWVTAGSPQLIRNRAVGDLRELETWRKHLGHDASDEVVYELADKPNAKSGKKLKVEMGTRRPAYGAWPDGESRRLKGDIGYLRLPRMDDDLILALRKSMTEFRDTRGLIVDVRGNGGGSRGLLIALAGYLLAPDEGPWIANVAAYRKSRSFGGDHLEARFMHRADDSRLSEAQVAAIETVARNFKPEWQPGAGFSEWHYLVLDRTGDAAEYFYDKPVVVLSDASCFSATDIFLAGLSGRPRVTLMGSASGGGSARTQGFQLTHSGIQVFCASMASFRTDGRLYDGRGIEVDVEVDAGAKDFIREGPDRRLDAALEHLQKR